MSDLTIIRRNSKTIAELRKLFTSCQSRPIDDVWREYDENDSYRLATIGDDPDNALHVVKYEKGKVVAEIARLFADAPEDISQETPDAPDAPETVEDAPETPEETAAETVAPESPEVPADTPPVSQRVSDTLTLMLTKPKPLPVMPTEGQGEIPILTEGTVITIRITEPGIGNGATVHHAVSSVEVQRCERNWCISADGQKWEGRSVESATRNMATALALVGKVEVTFVYIDSSPMRFSV